MLNDSWVLETWTGPATLDQIGDGLERLWGSHPHVPHNIRLQVGIAAAEIAANIVEHAAQCRPVRMRMRVRVGPERVRVCFADDGRPADIDLGNAASPDAMSERGRGLAMAQQVLERLRYRRYSFNHWLLLSRRFG